MRDEYKRIDLNKLTYSDIDNPPKGVTYQIAKEDIVWSRQEECEGEDGDGTSHKGKQKDAL